MAIRRSSYFFSQLRVDVPDLRSIESSIRSDFDESVESIITGENLGFVIRGFELNMTGAIGNSANGLSVIVSDSAVLHTTSLVSGTIFKVSSGSPVEILNSTVNTKVLGNFSPNSTNYVSLDFKRAPDASTQAPRGVWDPTNRLETSKVLPTAELLSYQFKITTTGFAADTLPVAVVQTDAANNVTSITDRRPMLYRLGSAGFSSPDPSHVYPWSNHSEGRSENPPTSTSSTNPFHGGDKQIKSLKEWMDSVMSIIKEITGGVYWYTMGAGGSISSIRADGINTVTTSRAVITHSAVTPGKLNWDYDIHNRVIGSRLTYTITAYASGSSCTLTDGQVAYINLVRDLAVAPNLIFTNASAVITSVGAIAWTVDLVAGDYLRIDGAGQEGYYKILTVDSPSQVTLTTVYTGSSTGPTGSKAQYAFGLYNIVTTPTTDRHVRFALREAVPIAEDVFWFFFRDDNGGSVPKIHTRYKAGELEQGESQQIADNTSMQLLQFVGSTSESDSAPNYLILPNGLATYPILNGDSLLKASYQTIGNVNDILTTLNNPSYDESVSGVAIVADTLITIPVNTRLGGSPQQFYTVGKGALEVYLNGQRLPIGATGWDELGTPGNPSSDIEIHQDILTTDLVTYRIGTTGGPGSGGGGGSAPDDDFNTLAASATADPSDYVLIYDVSLSAYRKQLRSVFLAGATNDYVIITKTVDYSVLITDNIVLVDTTSAARTMTLPAASAAPGHIFIIKKIAGGALNALNITAVSGNVENLSSISTVTDGESFTLSSDGSNYWIL